MFPVAPPAGIWINTSAFDASDAAPVNAVSVNGFEMTTCSGYKPGHTSMVEPEGTALTAAWIVWKPTNFMLQFFDPTG
jgi:hypothetical protein